MERGLAHLDAIWLWFPAHIGHRENEERVVRRLGHPVADAEDRSRAASDARLLRHLPLDRLDDRLAGLDVSGGDRPQAFRRAVRLADHEEFSIADEERSEERRV